jgi:hypothetical protein
MRSKLAAAVGGLVLAVALGAPVGAQAAVIHSGAGAGAGAGAASVKAGVRPESTPPGDDTCASIWDEGIGEYASPDADPQEDDLTATYFEPLSDFGSEAAVPVYCNLSVTSVSGVFQIFDGISGECLQPVVYTDGSNTYNTVDELACGTSTTTYWYATPVSTYHSQTVYVLTNYDSGVCLYDYLQVPATYVSPCSDSDHFEWFVWDALP